MKTPKLTIGMLAHVDAGKTTLAEAMLFNAGAIRKAGRVDHRDTFLDNDGQERSRGITIFSKQAELTLKTASGRFEHTHDAAGESRKGHTHDAAGDQSGRSHDAAAEVRKGHTHQAAGDQSGRSHDAAAESQKGHTHEAARDQSGRTHDAAAEVQAMLIDTPGHVDFSTEMERTLKILDCAVLIISAPDGIQSHTLTLWQLLNRYQIPTIIYINKTDLIPSTDLMARKLAIISSLKSDLGDGCFAAGAVHEILEQLAAEDEMLLDEYFETGTLSSDSILSAVSRRSLTPCFFGSALKNEGVTELMTFLQCFALRLADELCSNETYGKIASSDMHNGKTVSSDMHNGKTASSDMPDAGTSSSGKHNGDTPFLAYVYKITRDEKNTRLTHMKILTGSIAVKDMISLRADFSGVGDRTTLATGHFGENRRAALAMGHFGEDRRAALATGHFGENRRTTLAMGHFGENRRTALAMGHFGEDRRTALAMEASGAFVQEKIQQIRIYSGPKFRTVQKADAGDIIAVPNLEDAQAGDLLARANSGEPRGAGALFIPPMIKAAMVYGLVLPEGCDVHKTFVKLKQLEEEDPQLKIAWSEQLQEIQFCLMGEVQKETLKEIILRRFGIDADFSEGRIAYKETVSAPVLGAGHYEPLRHYAEVHLLIEPLNAGGFGVAGAGSAEQQPTGACSNAADAGKAEQQPTGAQTQYSADATPTSSRTSDADAQTPCSADAQRRHAADAGSAEQQPIGAGSNAADAGKAEQQPTGAQTQYSADATPTSSRTSDADAQTPCSADAQRRHAADAGKPYSADNEFASLCSEDDLDRNWQRLIFTHLTEREHMGPLTNSPLANVKISLVGGKAHDKHTEGGDFRQATYRAIRQGLLKAMDKGQMILLEPWFDFKMTLPADALGRAMSDIKRMGGSFDNPESAFSGSASVASGARGASAGAQVASSASGDSSVSGAQVASGASGASGSASGNAMILTGRAPVSEMKDYPLELASYTKGYGKILCTNAGYFPCHNQEAVLSMTDYDPLRDIENPGDSIFCAHGAGHNVSYGKADELMHVRPNLAQLRGDALAGENYAGGIGGGFADDGHDCRAGGAGNSGSAGRAGGAGGASDLDDEGNRYFALSRSATEKMSKKSPSIEARQFDSEIRKRERAAEKRRRAKLAEKQRKENSYPELLLVDGYNVIFAWEKLKQIAIANIDAAREALLEILNNYQGFRDCTVVAVFDAYKVRGGERHIEKVGDVVAIYTEEAESADSYIEKVTFALADKGVTKKSTANLPVKNACGVTGARELGVRETGARETGARELGVRETGARETGARELGVRETGARETGARNLSGLDSDGRNLGGQRKSLADYIKEGHYRIRVATSDSMEQLIITGHDACKISSSELIAEITATEAEINETIKRYQANPENRLVNRIKL